MYRILAIISILTLLVGCGHQTRYTSHQHNRYWDCEYIDAYSIQTEPLGCRVYVQNSFVGESPVTGSISGIKFRLDQSGDCSYAYDWNIWNGKNSNFRADGKTCWEAFRPKSNSYDYTVKAFKSGYYPTEQRIRIDVDDHVFLRSISNVKVSDENRIATVFTGKRQILLVLRPIPETTRTSPKGQQQQQQQQQTIIFQKE